VRVMHVWRAVSDGPYLPIVTFTVWYD
jgi:hypothetical protein